MAHFNEHCRDCEGLLGDRCEDVNRWLDECFKQYGPLHRFVRHHVEGAEEAGKLFGEKGRKAALIHILKDCGKIPTVEQWKNKEVDVLGIDPCTPFNGYWDIKEFDEVAKNLV